MADSPTTITSGQENGRPWWQVCCGGCVLFLIAFVVGGFLLMRALVGPGVVPLSHLPDNFPKDIVPFHLSEAQSITYLAGQSKSKMLNVLAAPMKLFAEAAGREETIRSIGEDAQYIDTVTVTWKNLAATRKDVLAYYTDLLKKANLETEVSHEDEITDSLSGITEGMIVQLTLHGEASAPTIEDAQLVVSYSNKR